MTLEERERAWYVLKAHGRKGAPSPEALDVMRVCDDMVAGRPAPALSPESDVALTSPLCFRPEGAGDPRPLPRVRLTFVDPKGGTPVGEGRVEVRLLGETTQAHELTAGRAEMEMPVNAVLRVQVPGHDPLHRSLYLDYPPYRRLVEALASGSWLDAYGGRERFRPGQVPWEAFHLAEAREILSEVDWTVVARPNERDALRGRFEESFE